MLGWLDQEIADQINFGREIARNKNMRAFHGEMGDFFTGFY
jgi:hypothetical protein